MLCAFESSADAMQSFRKRSCLAIALHYLRAATTLLMWRAVWYIQSRRGRGRGDPARLPRPPRPSRICLRCLSLRGRGDPARLPRRCQPRPNAQRQACRPCLNVGPTAAGAPPQRCILTCSLADTHSARRKQQRLRAAAKPAGKPQVSRGRRTAGCSGEGKAADYSVRSAGYTRGRWRGGTPGMR